MSKISLKDFPELVRGGRRWIDVRAPVEFAQGHIPGAINLPLLEDDERAAVGTAYKEHGQEAAIALGHKLVHGDIKDARVRAWREVVQKQDAYVYCFRGGLRSQISTQWLREAGSPAPLLEGGYKAARTFLISETARLSAKLPFTIVTGASGSGKTDFLRAVSSHRAIVDLEDLAAHRGSAFGALSRPQPAQAVFENHLARELMRAEQTRVPILIEDESWTIGKCQVPAPLFERISTAAMICIEEDRETRARHILEEYVRVPLRSSAPGELFPRFEAAVHVLAKRLGGLRAREILGDIQAGRAAANAGGDLGINLVWIEKLLDWYYDAFYEARIASCAERIIFRGTRRACIEWAKS